ncbi:MAG: GNAT family N-acetyltransferase [Myxococcota bacterium]
MDITVTPVTADHLADAARLFGASRTTSHCWCMWFVTSVRAFHAAGADGNQAHFAALAADSRAPMGLLAHVAGDPVGWCAAGPRSRYARAIRTPSFGDRDPAEDDDVWLVPCLYVRPEHRRGGVARALLEGAVAVAWQHEATAIEAFPFAGSQRRSGPDLQVGVEPLFASCGFAVVRRPSANRVVMRRALTAAGGPPGPT